MGHGCDVRDRVGRPGPVSQDADRLVQGESVIRWPFLLSLLLGVQLLLCLLAVLSPFLDDCGACSRGPGAPAILGILFYSGLLAGVLLRGFSPEVLLGVFF